MVEVLESFNTVEFAFVVGLIAAVIAIAILSVAVIRRTKECDQAQQEIIELHGEMVALRAEVFALETLTSTLKRVVRRLENAKTHPG